MSKNKKHRLPKRIAGVKIPKAIRKSGVGDFLASPGGKAVLAEVAVAAGALFAAKEAIPESDQRRMARGARKGLDHVGDAAMAKVSQAGDAVSDASQRYVYAFREAAEAFRAALRRYDAQQLEIWADDDRPTETAPPKKKSAARTASSGLAH